MKVGLTLPYSDEIPREGITELARLADRLGYETLWVREGYGWDAVAAVTDAMGDLGSIVGPAAGGREGVGALGGGGGGKGGGGRGGGGGCGVGAGAGGARSLLSPSPRA